METSSVVLKSNRSPGVQHRLQTILHTICVRQVSLQPQLLDDNILEAHDLNFSILPSNFSLPLQRTTFLIDYSYYQMTLTKL